MSTLKWQTVEYLASLLLRTSYAVLMHVSDALRLLRADLERQFAMEGALVKKASLAAMVGRAFHPRFLPLLLCRFSRALFLMRVPLLPSLASYLNLALFGIQITPRCEIGPGLFLPHTVGTVIGSWKIGANVTIFQQVTLGARTVDIKFTTTLLPEIADNVTIGTGAKVLGGIRLGNNVTVGANAVVLQSVEPGETVVGIPAHSICRKQAELV